MGRMHVPAAWACRPAPARRQCQRSHRPGTWHMHHVWRLLTRCPQDQGQWQGELKTCRVCAGRFCAQVCWGQTRSHCRPSARSLFCALVITVKGRAPEPCPKVPPQTLSSPLTLRPRHPPLPCPLQTAGEEWKGHSSMHACHRVAPVPAVVSAAAL